MLTIKSLREQVYAYLRDEMQTGNLLPGAPLNLNEISQRLGVSKTPLRDALIQLEVEGFVTIEPRRSVVVNGLTLQDVKNAYDIIGALEASAIQDVFPRLNAAHIQRLEALNADQYRAIEDRDFERYYRKNLEFHDQFLNLSDNTTLRRIITPIKLRLYDFPRRSYILDWELTNLEEHGQLIDAVRAGDPSGAATILKDRHWSFAEHEDDIRSYYRLAAETIKAENRHRQANGS
jgi:DNA-binding GntR family transcriptional regulator